MFLTNLIFKKFQRALENILVGTFLPPGSGLTTLVLDLREVQLKCGRRWRVKVTLFNPVHITSYESIGLVLLRWTYFFFGGEGECAGHFRKRGSTLLMSPIQLHMVPLDWFSLSPLHPLVSLSHPKAEFSLWCVTTIFLINLWISNP